jgi:hypothetical protein
VPSRTRRGWPTAEAAGRAQRREPASNALLACMPAASPQSDASTSSPRSAVPSPRWKPELATVCDGTISGSPVARCHRCTPHELEGENADGLSQRGSVTGATGHWLYRRSPRMTSAPGRPRPHCAATRGAPWRTQSPAGGSGVQSSAGPRCRRYGQYPGRPVRDDRKRPRNPTLLPSETSQPLIARTKPSRCMPCNRSVGAGASSQHPA